MALYYYCKMGVDKFANFLVVEIGKFKDLKFRLEGRGLYNKRSLLISFIAFFWIVISSFR